MEGVQQTWVNRLINTIICRGDLANEKLEAAPISVNELFRYSTRSDKIRVLFGIILAVIVGVLQPITCVVNGYIANIYLKDPDHIGNDALWKSAVIWCGISGICGIIIAFLSYLQSYLLMKSCSNIVRRMRREFVKAVLHQKAEWFDATQAGDISSKLNDNVERIRDGMGDKIGLILRGFSMFIASVIFSFAVNWRVTIVSIGVGPLGAMTMGLMARFSAKPMRQMMKASNEAGSIAEESIMNVKTVAACNGQNTMIKKYQQVLDACKKIAIRVYAINGVFEGCMFFQLYLFFIVGILYGVISFFDEEAGGDPGTILMAANAVLMGGYFLSLLGPHMMSVLKARVAAAVIYKIIDSEADNLVEEAKGIHLDTCKGKIEFKDVHFKYPTRETPILNGSSWTAESGETIAFVGHSGCGKSSSIGLLTRLYAPNSGCVTLDDVPVQDINVKSLRRLIGIVQQEPCLFNGTIRENIMLGRNYNETMVVEAAKTANAHDFIQKLEKGYDTVLGVGGVSLSGGQKQRIAIARAIVSNPRILLLDEATSALDTESERIVQLALNRASRGRTTIIIAHRLSTLKDVNRIHVIDKGVVVEIGSHFELMNAGGLYSTLAKAQEVGLVEKERKRRTSNSITQFAHEHTPHETILRTSLRSSGRILENTIATLAYEEENKSKKTTKDGKEEKEESPFMRLYFGTGKWNWQMYATVTCCLLRGLELPAYSYLQIFPYLALQSTKDDYSFYLWASTIAFTVVGFWSWFFISSSIALGGYSAETLVNRLRISCLRSLLHKDAAYFDLPEKSNAACVSTISLHAPTIMACFDYRFMLLSNNVVALVVCLLLTFISSWEIGLTSCGLILIFILLLVIVTLMTNKCMRKKSDVDETAEFAIEIFEQARTIQLLSVEDYFCKRYLQFQDVATSYEDKLCCLQSLTFSITLSFVYFSDMLCYFVGAYAIYYGRTTSALAFVAALAANFSGWSVIFASPCFNDMMKANAAARSLFKLMEKNSHEENEDEGEEPEIEGSLSVEKVFFAYPTRPDNLVARSLNLRAAKGHAIALVGASGCGKSTIIQLLERFYTPNQGKIHIDGNNILGMSLRHLRKKVALVGQEPVLFKGTISENICLGCEEEVGFDEIKKAAEMANAASFIHNLPQGYDTDVGEKGRSLSGGQKQRIAIARALVRNPRILLLDEATSALDTQSEEIVQKALNEASAGRTSITIAHRLSTIRNADRIYYIENGAVVEYGTHDELIEADGKYAKLVEAQSLQPQ